MGKFLLGWLFECKFQIFAIKNQSTSYSKKVAWILKFLILLVFWHKSCGFSLNSRFPFIVISDFAHPWATSQISAQNYYFVKIYSYLPYLPSLAISFAVKAKTRGHALTRIFSLVTLDMCIILKSNFVDVHIGPKFQTNLSHKFSLNLTYWFFVRQLRRAEKHGGKTYLK